MMHKDVKPKRRQFMAVTNVSADDYSSLIQAIEEYDIYNIRLQALENETPDYLQYITTSDGITNITHNLDYDYHYDKLYIIYDGLILVEGDNYTNNSNYRAIDLVGWSLSKGETLDFLLFNDILGKRATDSTYTVPSFKIETDTFTSNSDNTSIATFSFTKAYNTATDYLKIYHKGIKLIKDTDYSETDNSSILLLDWKLLSGDSLEFELYKNVK